MKHIFTFVVGALFGYGFKSDPKAMLGLAIFVTMSMIYGFLVNRNEEYRRNRRPNR